MADTSPQVRGKHDHYKLTGVTVTEKILNSGPYTIDVVLDYAGLKCIGKKLHPSLFMQGEATTKVRQLKEQCHLLSQIRHPNIILFLGLFFQQSPILVMEYIPYDLASIIDQYGTLPIEVSYSILYDVALGLDYLHSQTPPINHGELSASKTLLTPTMSAKILYLGVVNILQLSQPEVRYMAKKRSSLAYVAPEMISGSLQRYNCSTDVFSYGILIFHTLTGKEPELHDFGVKPKDKLCAALEEDTRSDSLLQELALRCTNSNSELRPLADELVSNLAKLLSEHPSSFINRVEMLREIKMSSSKQEKRDNNFTLQLEENIGQKKEELMTLQQEIDQLTDENKSLSQEVRTDEDLIFKTITDLQNSLKGESQKNDKGTQTQSDELDMQDSPQENDNVKLYGPKPKIIPRTMPPGKHYVNVSPKIDRVIRKTATTETTDLTSSISSSSSDSSSSLDNIRLGILIGQGRFFEVWNGKWNGDGRVAIKKLKEQFTFAENIRDEIATMKSFHHPNLVQFYAAGTSKHTLYLIVEQTEGEVNLLDYLRKEGKVLQFRQLIETAEQIAAGMAYLEQRNYVHQSLSACNVVLTKDLLCKVSDYGVVRLITQVDQDSSVPMFLQRITAPEAFLHGQFTVKSDVWSFGILLYELVTYGSLPYLDIPNSELMTKLKAGYRTPCPDKCEEKLYKIILDCWREEPESRPTFESLRWQMDDYFSIEDDGYIYMRAKRTN